MHKEVRMIFDIVAISQKLDANRVNDKNLPHPQESSHILSPIIFYQGLVIRHLS